MVIWNVDHAAGLSACACTTKDRAGDDIVIELKGEKPYQDLMGQIEKEDASFSYGGSADLYRGRWKPAPGGESDVAMKVLRWEHPSDIPCKDWNAERHFKREFGLWADLSHPNVLELHGLCSGFGPLPALVSPYCKDHSVIDFINKNKHANRLRLVIGVANGLRYLHSIGIVHGDLKGQNILVSPDGDPWICDFGRARKEGERGFTTRFAGTFRYVAPELFLQASGAAGACGEHAREFSVVTRASDVYAFAMVALEILTGREPLWYYTDPIHVLFPVMMGERPRRSEYVLPVAAGPLWELLEDCWQQDPNRRPDIAAVLQCLTEIRDLYDAPSFDAFFA